MNAIIIANFTRTTTIEDPIIESSSTSTTVVTHKPTHLPPHHDTPPCCCWPPGSICHDSDIVVSEADEVQAPLAAKKDAVKQMKQSSDDVLVEGNNSTNQASVEGLKLCGPSGCISAYVVIFSQSTDLANY
jgi:hypothetical protein